MSSSIPVSTYSAPRCYIQKFGNVISHHRIQLNTLGVTLLITPGWWITSTADIHYYSKRIRSSGFFGLVTRGEKRKYTQNICIRFHPVIYIVSTIRNRFHAKADVRQWVDEKILSFPLCFRKLLWRIGFGRIWRRRRERRDRDKEVTITTTWLLSDRRRRRYNNYKRK